MTKFVSPEVFYLDQDEITSNNSAYFDVLLTSEDGVTYQTTRLVLAANAPAMRETLLSAEDEQISIYIESHSKDVLELLKFFHTGYIFREIGSGDKLSELLSHLGVNLETLVGNSDTVPSPPPLSDQHFIATGITKMKSECTSHQQSENFLSNDLVLTKIEELKDSADARIKDLKQRIEADGYPDDFDGDFWDDTGGDYSAVDQSAEDNKQSMMPVVKLEKLEMEPPSPESAPLKRKRPKEDWNSGKKRRKERGLRASLKKAGKFEPHGDGTTRVIENGNYNANIDRLNDPGIQEGDTENNGTDKDAVTNTSSEPPKKKLFGIHLNRQRQKEAEARGEVWEPKGPSWRQKRKAAEARGEAPRKRGRPRGKAVDAKLNWTEAYYYFPQKGEKDCSKRYQCTQCVRAFEKFYDFEQHKRRHNRKSDQEVFFCLNCDDAAFSLEASNDYNEHRKKCEGIDYSEVLYNTVYFDTKKYVFHFPQSADEDMSYPFNCQLCIRRFAKKDKFEQHLRRHINSQKMEDAFACLFCNNATFPTCQEMWKHNQKCRKDKNSHLPLPADVKELYERHNLIEAPNFVKNHLCGHCGQAFAKRETMLNHCKNYGPYHDYKCANDNCDFVYWSWEEHKEHCDLKHGGQLMVRCGICPEVFISMIHVITHRAQVHKGHTMKGNDKTTVCTHCGRNFHKHYLKAHVERYHGTENLKCPEEGCGKSFNSSILMKEHMAIHTRQYTCDECGFASSTFTGLRMHKISFHVREEDKPFKCSFEGCVKGFATHSALKEHLNIHYNIRPYKCEQCSASFNSAGNYYAHIRAHKGIKRHQRK